MDDNAPKEIPPADFNKLDLSQLQGFSFGTQWTQEKHSAPERGPYESPYYSVTFYPEDTSFNTLVQTIRKSCRTVELFEIARTVVDKTDRFVVVVTHKPPAAAPAPKTGEATAAATGEAGAA